MTDTSRHLNERHGTSEQPRQFDDPTASAVRCHAHNPVVRTWEWVAAILAVITVTTWASDAVTLKGERTVYTVECQSGQWRGVTCNGSLVAGPRYRFRALRAHGEVIFWTAGAAGEPSGKFEGCRISDGRNWTCPISAAAARTITVQMQLGVPVPDASGNAKRFHAIAKWRWWLVRLGVPVGSDADN